MASAFAVKDPIEIRSDMLRTIKNGLIERGVTNPNIGPGSDVWVFATAIANEIAVVEANAVIKCDEQMPDTSTGDGIARIAAILQLVKQPAAGSIGSIIIEASATSPIVSGTELTDEFGLRYQVTAGGDYADGEAVAVAAIDTGSSTNHAAGDTLRWSSAPPFCSDIATVAAGGLVNGADEEDDEALRARILAFFQNPPGSGNWEHAAEVAEASTGSIQKAFVYPAIEGPGTHHIAVTAAPTESSKERDVESAIMAGAVEPYVYGKLPEHAYLVVTTVENVDADVAFALSLPESPTANPPGPGGGWRNGTPWPTPDGSSTFRCTVTTATSSTQLTVDATTSPTAGVTKICWLSPSTWTLYRALVTAVSGTSGAYVITLDKPFPNIVAGAYIWPDCENAQAYVNAVLAAFALMGPGEKTSNASALARGFRHPHPANGWPYTLGPHLLRAATEAGREVLSAQFLHRTDGTTTLTGTASVIAPQIPASVEDPPNILIPRNIAFYRVP